MRILLPYNLQAQQQSLVIVTTCRIKLHQTTKLKLYLLLFV